MKKIFDKNEITFAIILIVIYVVGSSAMKRVSESIGVEWLAEMIFGIMLTAVILMFIKKNQLEKYFGLCGSKVSGSKMLFYIPMWLSACSGLFFGLNQELETSTVITHTIYMIFAGFLEEIIFRGFLFRAMEKENLKRAVIVTSITFGIGHIVNLINGNNVSEEIIQVIHAVACGFMLVIILLKTGSLFACIAFHALNNCLTLFTSYKLLTDNISSEFTASAVMIGIRLALIIGYTVFVLKKHKENKLNTR